MRPGSGTSAIVIGAALCLVVVACGPGPTPPGNGAGSAAPGGVVTANDSGVARSIALSSATVKGGQTISIAVAVTNIGLDELTYESGGCGATAGISVSGPPVTEAPFNENAPPVDTNGAPILALARWAALANFGPELDTIRKPGWPADAAFGCRANLAFDQLAPGGHLEDTWQWTARNGFHVPAAPGAYTVRFVFPLVGRGMVDPGMDDVREGFAGVAVEAPLTVLPADARMPVLTADQAIMAAIADPDVKAWANRALTRETMQDAKILFVDGVWRWTIGYPGGVGSIDIDPSNGTIVARHL